MKIRDIITPIGNAIGEDSLGRRRDDTGDISAPGAEPTVVRIGGSMVPMHDPSIMPDVLPLSTRPVRVNGRKAVLWKGIGVDGARHTFWSYDTAGIGEDRDTYLQDPLDPEGDTDGPGRTGDLRGVGEGEVVQFKRPGIRPDAQNMQLAKALASDLYWRQVSSYGTPEEIAGEEEVEDQLAKIGYHAEWDLDAPETTMVITHMPTGREYRMGEDEMIKLGTIGNDDISESMDMGSIMRMADSAIRSMPAAVGAANLKRNLGAAAKALAGVGAPLAILAGIVSGVASASPSDKPMAITDANSTVTQFLKAYEAAKTEEERCRLANDWYGVTPPNDVCDLGSRPRTVPDPAKCQDVYITRGANKGKTVRQCADPEMLMPPTNESTDVWDKPNPAKKHKKLSQADKDAARARAKRAGRKYPNMVDNIWAAGR